MMEIEEVIKIIEFRLERLNEVKNIVDANLEKFSMYTIDNDARIDELESLKNYIKSQK
jgi:hypothetical protein